MRIRSSALKPKKGETLKVMHDDGNTYTYESVKSAKIVSQLNKESTTLIPILQIERRDGSTVQHLGIRKVQIIPQIKSEKS